MKTIEICLGSSCFSRGNPENLRVLQEYLATNRLATDVNVRGHLCENLCSDGPNVTIDGQVHRNVTPAYLRGLLEREAKSADRK